MNKEVSQYLQTQNNNNMKYSKQAIENVLNLLNNWELLNSLTVDEKQYVELMLRNIATAAKKDVMNALQQTSL